MNVVRQSYSMFLLLLVATAVLGSFSPVAVQAEETPSNNITFEANSIPDLVVTDRPEDKPESFRFEWLDNRLDIELFFNASWQPEKLYSLNDFLVDIRNDWNCSNANVDFQVNRSDSSVNFGWVLDGVENVSDYVHNALFKLENTQPFDYDDIELEEVTVDSDEQGEPIEPYNITRFYLPDNLALSFEDLYHKGFVIGYQDKYSTSVKGFSGKSSWNLDPITVSGGIITLDDGTFSFSDLWEADKGGTLELLANTTAGNHILTTQVKPTDNKSISLEIIANNVTASGWANITGTEKDGSTQTENITVSANQTYTTTKYWKTVTYINCSGTWAITIQQSQWGVVWKTGDAQFMFDCRIMVGDTTTTWLIDTGVTVVFSSTACTTGQVLIDLEAIYGNVQFGTLEDETDKSTSQGVTVVILGSYNARVVRAKAATTANFYSSSFINMGSGTIDMALQTSQRVWNCILSGVQGYVIYDAYHTTLTKTTYGLMYPSGTVDFSESFISSNTYGFYQRSVFGQGSTIRTCIFRDNTYLMRGFSMTADNYIIDCESDSWVFLWGGTCTHNTYRQYSFDLNVTDNAGTPIQNANVTMKHYGQTETQDFTVLTGANGSFATKTLSRSFYNQTGGNSEYSFNNFNLTVTKSGYRTYTQNFTLTDKTDWKIKLDSTLDPVASFTFYPSNPDLVELVTFNATDCWCDPHTNITTYDWDFGDSTTTTGQTATHSYVNNGTYVVNLTITDGESNTDTLLQNITVRTVLNPVASFTFSPSNPQSGNAVAFDASGTWTDSYTNISSYTWVFGDGDSGSGVTVSHAYNGDGSYGATLTVTDSEGNMDTLSQTVTVYTPDATSPGGGGGSDGTDILPLPITYMTITISYAQKRLTYYPVFSPNYTMNLTVHNNATTEASGTVAYWLKNSQNGTVWQTTFSFLIPADSQKTLSLVYPIVEDGEYTAYAQVINPNKGEVLSNTFTASSGLGPVVPWVLVAILFVIAVVYLASRKTKKKKRKQKTGDFKEWPADRPKSWPSKW